MNRKKYFWLYDILFLLALVLAGYLRLGGLNWGGGEHQHPDENFLSMVLGNLRAQKCASENIPIDSCPQDQRQWMSLGDYFDSETSTLNPYNRGHSFFVYGNLPMTVVRVAVDAINGTDVKALGRQFSALADLFTIFFLYLIVSRLYDRRVGLLASLFSALTVMQIQQSHFFTTDLFANAFAFLAIYFAVEIIQRPSSNVHRPSSIVQHPTSIVHPQSPVPNSLILRSLITHPLFLLSLGFGVAYGMALASKLNIYPLALLLPAAFALRYFITDRNTLSVDETLQTISEETPPAASRQLPLTNYYLLLTACLIAGGIAAFLSFRVFQPYAFDGIGLNPQWIANIQEQRAQAAGADLPWNLQWARRTHLYSFENLTLWGLGLPLGILAWIGFLTMGWRILKGEWKHALLWGWTALYFIWQSLQFNPTMRYQLPIYPALAMMAAWVAFEPIRALRNTQYAVRTTFSVLRIVVTVIVVLLTAAWAFAFQSIYTRTEPRIAASRWTYQNIPGPINLHIETDASIYNQPLPLQPEGSVTSNIPYDISFVPQRDGSLTGVTLGHATNPLASSSTFSLTLSSGPEFAPEQTLATASLTSDFDAQADPHGNAYTLEFDRPVEVKRETPYYLRLETDSGALSITGSAVVNETDYDYPLPFRVDGYDAFGGLYRGDLNLQVYWDDNADKLARFTSTLDQADYIFIPTNHQYAQITRLPERYPLTTLYYRELMGCPVGADIIRCYHEAEPGDYEGRLGFDLVAVFTTYPKLGNFEINDQYAEEAFTFYDHPKVFIFKKNENYDAAKVQAILSAVDLTKVVRLTPRQFDDYKNLLLPADKLAQQRAGGTWSELFDYDWIQNKNPWLGLLIWYVFIFILGLAVYPLIRIVMPGLADKGYPLSRALGLVVFGWLAWMAGSLGVPYTRTTIAVVFGLILLLGAGLAYYQRDELREEWKTKKKYFLLIEGIFLTFFVIDLLIRLGNPDLWHPAKGGERPMDFSYFNAVLKSTSFPPYDPWFAGGYINYYYYGFVLVGTPVKLLGIVPSIAYNFILPTLFAIVGICAFSIGWNLLSPLSQREIAKHPEGAAEGEGEISSFKIRPSSLIAGLSASLLTILLGNLGTIQTIYNRMQQLGAAGVFSWESTFSQRLGWATHGLSTIIRGEGTLPIGPGDWYWDPSRVVPPRGGNEITEFPLFTFLYSDLHAHMIVMPLALLTISWALAVVAARGSWKSQAHPASEAWMTALGFIVGGLIVGAVYPTNLSDNYTYLLIGVIAIAYSVWRYANAASLAKRSALTGGAVVALFALARLLYQPYRAWYFQSYSALDPWKGPFTPISSYLTMWGVFLFIIVSWMVWETREWMAATPVSSLRKLKPFQILIEGALIVFAFILLLLQYNQSQTAYGGVAVSWIALPIAAWAAVLLLRPNLPDVKRFVLFLVGTALLITVVVEVFVVVGDIGRQNTIFKFYLQAWFMLAVSAAAAFTWTLPAFLRWLPGWRVFWQTALILLISSAALFTVTGTSGKVKDRWILEAPHTLDGMTYMDYAQYDEYGQRLNLSEDYRAIRWMQDNVKGSPVIAEAASAGRQYEWHSRFTIYTGLPDVVGWQWHQQQQRVLFSQQVVDRGAEVTDFYNSIDPESIRAFLKKYDVKYIIVGQLERAAYTPEGIAKFDQLEGQYWREVYRDGATVIYEVMP
ncbi:MAG: glycosyltransferase family 39 protein [Anaerolineales bacterium]|nr:glycosyltransferase family 39 protein [Anaerolineales bacterium]